MANENYVHLRWDDIERYCTQIHQCVKQSNKLPDVIIAVGRGGMIPARILSDLLGVRTVYMYNIKLYTGVNQRAAKPTVEVFSPYLTGKHILLVDDIMDTGATIEAVIKDIQAKRPTTIRTVTLIAKRDAKVKPTFCGVTCEEKDWIIFPWEKGEADREWLH